MTNRMIIENVLKSENRQFSAQEIFERAREENKSLQIETVYAIMKKLTKRKLVMKIRSDKSYYVYIKKDKLINI